MDKEDPIIRQQRFLSDNFIIDPRNTNENIDRILKIIFQIEEHHVPLNIC